MDEYDIFPPELMLELSCSLEEIFILYISYGSAYFDDGDISTR